MKRLVLAAAIAASALSGDATAQTDSAVPPAPATAARAPHLATTDRSFVKSATKGGLAEVAFGHLAEEKATSEAVKDLGGRMAADHSTSKDKLSALAKRYDVRTAPEMDNKQRSAFDKLKKASGAAFDRNYVKGQIAAHQKTIALFQKEANQGKNNELKSYASDTLPTLREHLATLQDLQAKMSSETAQKAPRTRKNSARNGASSPQSSDTGTTIPSRVATPPPATRP